MSFPEFPIKEYTLHTNYSVEEASSALSAQVMEKQVITITFLSQLTDLRRSKYKYFEGYANNENFKINHKTYRSQFTEQAPLSTGNFEQQLDGCNVHIKCSGPNISVLILFWAVPYAMICIALQLPVIMIQLGVVVIAILFLIILKMKHISYLYRLGQDKEVLKRLLNAEEI